MGMTSVDYSSEEEPGDNWTLDDYLLNEHYLEHGRQEKVGPQISFDQKEFGLESRDPATFEKKSHEVTEHSSTIQNNWMHHLPGSKERIFSGFYGKDAFFEAKREFGSKDLPEEWELQNKLLRQKGAVSNHCSPLRKSQSQLEFYLSIDRVMGEQGIDIPFFAKEFQAMCKEKARPTEEIWQKTWKVFRALLEEGFFIADLVP